MARPRPLPILTRAESEVIDLLWRHGPSTVTELVERLGRDVAYNTVLTITRILEQKGYVTHSAHPEGGRAHLYRAAIEPKPAQRQHVRDLLDRLFGGNARELVAGLIEEEALTSEELQSLRAEIDARLEPRKPRRPR